MKMQPLDLAVALNSRVNVYKSYVTISATLNTECQTCANPFEVFGCKSTRSHEKIQFHLSHVNIVPF